MLQGNTNEEKIWNYFMKSGMTKAGAAGMMGNILAESGFSSINLQNTGNTRLGMTDEEFTKAMDNGTYTNFIHDGLGYGLCQWTFWSLKQDLLNFAKSKGVSIGDLEMQLEFLINELNNDEFKNTVMKTLKSTGNVREASDTVLMNFERPGSTSDPYSQTCKDTKELRYSYSMTYYNKFVNYTPSGSTQPEGGNATVGYTNSPLAKYTCISPNRNSPRNHSIDRITIHCVVGQVTAASGAQIFKPSSFQASCNYIVGKDGDVALVVEERDRSWCTSSSENDNRAVTIETACDTTDPYWVTDKALNTLVDLCTDICRRNGKKKLLWFNDKAKTLAYTPASDEMVMTVHRWYANKACPGAYLLSKHAWIASEVTKRLGGSAPSTQSTPQYRVRKSWDDEKSQIGAYSSLENAKKAANSKKGYAVFDEKGNQIYPELNAGKKDKTFKNYSVKVTIDDLKIRTGPGSEYAATGETTGKGVFTIVEEKKAKNGTPFGRLMSGLGWINLNKVEKLK